MPVQAVAPGRLFLCTSQRFLALFQQEHTASGCTRIWFLTPLCLRMLEYKELRVCTLRLMKIEKTFKSRGKLNLRLIHGGMDMVFIHKMWSSVAFDFVSDDLKRFVFDSMVV